MPGPLPSRWSGQENSSPRILSHLLADSGLVWLQVKASYKLSPALKAAQPKAPRAKKPKDPNAPPKEKKPRVAKPKAEGAVAKAPKKVRPSESPKM